MVTEYGQEIVAVLRTTYLYSVPNHGSAPREYEMNHFYTYELLYQGHTGLFHTGIRMQLNEHLAHVFCEKNGYQYLTELPHLPSMPWPEDQDQTDE